MLCVAWVNLAAVISVSIYAADVQYHLPLSLFAMTDRNRWRVGLQPFPRAVPPPAPVSEQRKKEILADPRVQEVQQRNNNARQQQQQQEQEVQQKEKVTVGV